MRRLQKKPLKQRIGDAGSILLIGVALTPFVAIGAGMVCFVGAHILATRELVLGR